MFQARSEGNTCERLAEVPDGLTAPTGRDRDKCKALTPRSHPHVQCHRNAGHPAPGAVCRSPSPRYRSRCTPSPPDLEPRQAVGARHASRLNSVQTEKQLKHAIRALTGGRRWCTAARHLVFFLSNSKHNFLLFYSVKIPDILKQNKYFLIS